MNYQEVLDYMFSRLPMYQRIGKAAYKADLATTIKLDNYFGNPHKRFKTIHIAGTNGKGSVAHTIASVLQEAGYKTGLYTSPHYLDFRERIKINGQMIPEAEVISFIESNKNFFETVKPSFFEMTVAMAFDYFAKQNVDVAVIETGLGGRLDSTNIITPILSIITNIGYDHTRFLGSTLKQIATEKAGIIKHNVPVVIGENRPELKAVFSKKVQEVDAPVFFTSHFYTIKSFFHDDDFLIINTEKNGKPVYAGLYFALTGDYQRFNVPVILQSVEILKKNFKINEKHVYAGFKNVVKNTGIMGRWQILQKNPMIIADAGHNAEGIEQVMKQLKSLNFNKLRIIFGLVNDKNTEKIIKLLNKEAIYYITQSSVQRSKPYTELLNSILIKGLNAKGFKTVEQAVEMAINEASVNDVIFIGGSTFIVADALEYFKKTKKNKIIQ